MVMVFLNSVRRWWMAGAGAHEGLPLPEAIRAASVRPAIAQRRVTPRSPAIARRLPAKPLTPFGALARARGVSPVSGSSPMVTVLSGRRAARRFWMTLDPHDRRHAALGGSFAEVCAALERLAALEEQRL